MKKFLELAALCAAACLPAGGAHYLFYSGLGLAPSDVGLDFGDIVLRSLPGLMYMVALTAATIVALYSAVIWLNLMALAAGSLNTKRLAKQLSIAAAAIVLVALVTGPQGVAAVVLVLWFATMTVIGLASLFPDRWRDMGTGILVGAPAYVVLSAAVLVLLPALTQKQGRERPDAFLIENPFLLLGAAVVVLAAWVVLQLPSLLVLAHDADRTGWGWTRLRQARSRITAHRARLIFAGFALVAAHMLILALAFWNAEVIKSGSNPGIFGVAWFDQAVRHTYGLPVRCVAVKRARPYPQSLPRTAIKLGSRSEASHALVWDRRGAMVIPSEVVQLRSLRRPDCVSPVGRRQQRRSAPGSA